MFFVLAAALVSVSAAHQIWPMPDDFQLPQLPPDASDRPSSCTDADFPHDLNGLKVDGLQAHPTVKSADDCRAACCDAGASCQVFEWTPTRASGSNCWIGRYAKPEPGSDPGRGYISRARGNIPPPPPPPPPPFPPGQPHILDDSKGLGLRWEGIGAISGGGATSKLLMDYEPSVVADILDFLFKPSEIHHLSHCPTWLPGAPSNHHAFRALFMPEPP